MESCCANIRQERRKAESISDFLERTNMAEPHPYYFVDFALPQPLEGSSSETQPLGGRHSTGVQRIQAVIVPVLHFWVQ